MLELITVNFNLHFSVPPVWNNLGEDLKSSSLRIFRQAMMKKIPLYLRLMLAWYCIFVFFFVFVISST